MTEYQRTLEWLYALEAAKGMDFKLERVALALRHLGDPQAAFACLHVAGTNGKGSVAAMLHAVLTAAGYRTGLYTSPHLHELTERVRVGNEDLARAETVALAAEVRAVTATRGIALTFFEILTVMAFVHFARRAVDVAVVEVGLGGRLDATNVIDPLAAVITTIGLDHTEWLGDTLAAIAVEKGGIIKPGRPVVLGPVGGEAAAVLHRIAAERGARVIQAGRDYRAGGAVGVDFDGLGWRFADLPLALRGAFQRDNAGTALATLAAVRERVPVGEDAIRAGLASVRWPGRFEVAADTPLTILDGAHNADGVAALMDSLGPLVGTRRLHLLFAVMGDKDWRPMVDRLGPRCRSVTVTEVQRPRGAPAAAVAEAFRAWCPAASDPDPARAWASVRERAQAGDAILVTGSLFLIGAVRGLYTGPGAAAARVAGAVHP